MIALDFGPVHERSDGYWTADHPLSAEEMETALSRAGRNEAPAMLFDLYVGGLVDRAALAAILPGVWSGAEWPCANVPPATWRGWFRACEYPGPSAPITVYRGARPRYARGMSWTSDQDKARWFADRWQRVTDHPTHVYVVTVEPAGVLADIDALEGDGGRGEHEVVTDPALLPRRIARS